jgi:hypothetical protein
VPGPENYDGEPPCDVNDDLRLRDVDGDGLAQGDMGACELLNEDLVPPEVQGLEWSSDETFEWAPEPQASSYSVYRDDLASISYARFGSCLAQVSDTSHTDAETPEPATGFAYLVSARDATDEEGTLGYGTSAERSCFTPCP